MPQPAHLLLQQPEGKTLEFKRDLSSPRNVLKTLVAFANSAGRRLVIGVDDDRTLLGVTDPLDAVPFCRAWSSWPSRRSSPVSAA